MTHNLKRKFLTLAVIFGAMVFGMVIAGGLDLTPVSISAPDDPDPQPVACSAHQLPEPFPASPIWPSWFRLPL